MTYTIRKTDDTLLTELDDEIIDSEKISGIDLIGYLTPNYGESQSNNFVHLVENFANYKFPDKPLVGQLCYKKSDSGDGSLYLCVNNSEDIQNENDKWKKMPLVYVGEEAPEESIVTGDMWYDTKEHAFKLYDEVLEKWVSIGPENYNNLIKIVDEKNLENGDNAVIYSFVFKDYDLDANYLFTINVMSKEISKSSGYIQNCNTGACKIQLLVNCYHTSSSNYKCEIVDMPDYEIIGKNDPNWNVKAYIDVNSNNDKVLNIKATGSTSSDNTRIKWITKMDVLKVK